MLDRGGEGRDRHGDQAAETLAFREGAHLRNLLEHLRVGGALRDRAEDAPEQIRLHDALRALAAGLALKKLRDLVCDLDDALVVLDDAENAAAQRRAPLDQRLPVHGDVEVVRGQESARWATGEDSLHGPAARQPAAVCLDELAE